MVKVIMTNIEIWKIFVTVAIAVLGWIVANYFNSRRDRATKRRELITDHLINTHKILTIDITQREPSTDRDYKLESVIAELQLFGSEEQIELTKKLTDDINHKQEFLMDELINNLRNALRKELGLSSIRGNVRWLRFEKKAIK
jgi:hypothetical protein